MSDAPVSSGAPAAAPTSSPAPAAAAPKASIFDNLPGDRKAAPAPKAEAKPEPKVEAKEESQAEVKTQAEVKAEIKEEIRKLKMKVNGREFEMAEPEVIRRAQLYESSNEKFQSAAEKEKQINTFVEALKTNPMAVLTHPDLGINFRELAEQYLVEQIQQESMDPKDRELEDLRKFKSSQEEQKRKAEEETMTRKQQEQFEQQVQTQREQYDQQMGEILSKSGLPKNPRTIKRVAELMYGAVQKGYDLPIDMAVDMVRESYVQDIQEMVSQLGEDQYESILGDQLVGKLRKRDLARLKNKMRPNDAVIPASETKAQAQSQSQAKPKTHMTTHEWNEHIRKKAGF